MAKNGSHADVHALPRVRQSVRVNRQQPQPQAAESPAECRALPGDGGHGDCRSERPPCGETEQAVFEPHVQRQVVRVRQERHLDEKRVLRQHSRELVAAADARERSITQ